jgi:hypothetical protein
MSGKQSGGFSKTVKSGSTQVIVNNQKKQGKKPTEQKQKPPQEFKPFGKGGVRIGEDESDDKWRCVVCTFQNDLNAEFCVMCGSAKSSK